jgi:hypothetical protein
MPRRIIPALRLAGLLLGVALVALLVHRLGTEALRSELSRVGPGFLWLPVAYALATAVSAVPWGVLMPPALRPSWTAVIASRFAASGINVLLPFFGLGEAGRLLWMARPAWPRGTAAIIADRLLFIAAGACLILAAVGAAAQIPGVPAMVTAGGAVLALAIIGATIAIGALAARGQLAGRGTRLLRRLGLRPAPRAGAEDGRGERTAAAAAPVWDQALRELLVGSRRSLLAGLGVHLVARLLFAAEIYVGLRLLGVRTGWREALIMAAVPIALSVVGTFVPAQVGLQEACQSLIAGVLGINPASALALVLLQRARQLLFVPMSGLLVAAPVRKHAARTRA